MKTKANWIVFTVVLFVGLVGVSTIAGCGSGTSTNRINQNAPVRSAGHYQGTLTRRLADGQAATTPSVMVDLVITDDEAGTVTGTAVSSFSQLPAGSMSGTIKTDTVENQYGKYVPYSNFTASYPIEISPSGSPVSIVNRFVGTLSAQENKDGIITGVVISGDYPNGQSVEETIAEGWSETYDIVLNRVP